MRPGLVRFDYDNDNDNDNDNDRERSRNLCDHALATSH